MPAPPWQAAALDAARTLLLRETDRNAGVFGIVYRIGPLLGASVAGVLDDMNLGK